MADFGDGGAVDEVGEQAVAVGSHGDEVAMLGARVQTNTQQFYIDHGRHLIITSPAP